MGTESIVTDYLVIGAGAIGMAFVDTLLTDTDANVVRVDRRHRPGGHWNDAYPFVRLHQPAGYYGVNSRELGQNVKDAVGLNQGMYGLASGCTRIAV
jgi:cation diffusion facilitator CzcD-associated flavoprotein CzcO